MTRPVPKAPLIDINEAATRLGVSPRFVRRLVDERRIPFHKIGKFVRFDPADVDRYIVRGRVDAARS
jgi:excisionase family DNA binding protein